MALKAGLIYSYGFSSSDILPLLQMQRIQDSALMNYLQQSLLSESIMKRQRDMAQASVLAQPSAKTKEGKGEKGSVSTYSISYYNPILQKTEVLEAKSEIKIQDITTKMIEESVAAKSAYPIYQFIGTPLALKEVQQWKLEEILSQREYGTPPPPPAGAAVQPVRVITQKESEIVALKKREEEIKEALSQAVLRKERSERKIGEELLILEDTISALRSGEEIDAVLDRLPPLSRARYLLALKKKQLGRLAIINLLIKDAYFLRSTRKKLELFTLDDLMDIYRMLRNLQKR